MRAVPAADTLAITIKNAKGQIVSEGYTDSVRGYVGRALKAYISRPAFAKLCTLLVDMVNYGAAAQEMFGANVTDLANVGLEDYQNLATAETPACTNGQVKSANVGHGIQPG